MQDLQAALMMPVQLPEESDNEPDAAAGKMSSSAGIWEVFAI